MKWHGPPFDLTELASFRQLKVAMANDLADDQDACVMPGRVLLNIRKQWRHDGDDSEFERLCQIAGAEFLFPLEPFPARIKSVGLCLLGVLELAGAFDASIEATARRTVETASEPVLGVLFRPKDPTTGKWVEIRPTDDHFPYASLHASLVWQSDACSSSRILKGATPPKGSAADRAWKRVRLNRGCVTVEQTRKDDWSGVGLLRLWDSEAITLPKAAAVPHEVLCLMRQVVT